MPGRGWPRWSVFTVQALVGTIPCAELDVVIAAVCGPLDPFAASASVPIVVELATLVEAETHVASEDTLEPPSTMVPAQFGPGLLDARMEFDKLTDVAVSTALELPKNVSKFRVFVVPAAHT